MSASHFGTTYWLDDYFGPYFQPEGEGGVIIGSLAGSFSGVAAFTGAISVPVSHVYETRAGYPDKRKRKKRHAGAEAVLRAPVIPVTPELISALNNEPPSVPTQLFPLTAPQIVAGVDEDEDELLLMLAA